jgi:hypothetical protein
MLGRVVVLEHLGQATLKVEHAIDIGGLLAEELDDTSGVRLGRVFVLEDSLKVLCYHHCGCEVARLRRSRLRLKLCAKARLRSTRGDQCLEGIGASRRIDEAVEAG